MLVPPAVGWRKYTPAPIDWTFIFFLCNTAAICGGPLFPVRALSSSKHFCCICWSGSWLCVLVVSPMFALIIVFLEPLGSRHIFAILASFLSVGGVKNGQRPRRGLRSRKGRYVIVGSQTFRTPNPNSQSCSAWRAFWELRVSGWSSPKMSCRAASTSWYSGMAAPILPGKQYMA